MSLALRHPRMLAFIAFVVLTVLVVVLLSTMAHINALHMVGSLITPDFQYHHG